MRLPITCPPSPNVRRLLAGTLAILFHHVLAAQTPAETPDEEETPFILEPLVILGDDDRSPDYDPTGFGGADAERLEPPFANELLMDVGFDEIPLGGIDGELAALAASGSDAAEVAAGSESLNLRGFPTPRRRNGFTLAGIPEVINSERTETISASLVPVVGRAAPGGIRNSTTARPRGRVTRALNTSLSTEGTARVSAQATGVVKPKKAWYYSSASFSNRDGPQTFSELSQFNAAAAVAVRHSRATSTLWQLDLVDARGNPAPGIPEFRATPGSPILGAYLPLADFHTYGPNTSIARRGVSLSFQLETALSPDLSLSSGTQIYRRDSEQNRFTTGQYVLSTGLFSGVREPTRREEAFTGVTHQTDLTRRLDAFGASHKLRVGVEATVARTGDENRGILAADRNLYLPADVQAFDPFAPNYFRPAFSEAVYARVIADREIDLGYAALVADARSAFNRGRTVTAVGLRYDVSSIAVSDQRPGAPAPEADKQNQALSFHLGVNQRVGKRVLLFANASSAIEPSTRVDARTGEIQDNESTAGFEFGARTVLFERKLSLSTIAYQYTNTDIARRNPLYNDPVFDPDQTQPQLVTSGEEEFRGLTAQAGWKPISSLTLTARATWLDATTISSPDLPEEEGLPLARTPQFTAATGANYRFQAGRLKGFSIGGSVTHVGEVVQNYARADRVRIDYPAYTLVGLRAGFAWPAGKTRHSVSLSIANLLDEDMLAKTSRVGAERSLTTGWNVTF